jgi:hypothetical protein
VDAKLARRGEVGKRGEGGMKGRCQNRIREWKGEELKEKGM